MNQNKINQDVKDRIHQSKQDGMSFQSIYKTLKSEGVVISESYARKVYNKENPNDRTTITIKEPEEEVKKEYHFADEDDDYIPPTEQPRNTTNETEFLSAIDQPSQSPHDNVIADMNIQIKEQGAKIEQVIEKVKEQKFKPINMSVKHPKVNYKELDFSKQMADAASNEKRNYIIKIRNYLDAFIDEPDVMYICGGDVLAFKHKLYTFDIEQLHNIHEEIMVSLLQSSDLDFFMLLFNAGTNIAEVVASLLSQSQITGLKDEIYKLYDAKDIKMLACEASCSRYFTPKTKLIGCIIIALFTKLDSAGALKALPLKIQGAWALIKEKYNSAKSYKLFPQ